VSDVGVVAIGRNEGERLRQCLESVVGRGLAVVYVDSGSTDGSRERARDLGAEVVELDLSIPFTAARARNAGLERLRDVAPETRFVQFVDGDCEVVDGWLQSAQSALEARPELAVVCGRRRERYPEQSIYNRLADLEWDTPIGDARACGGDAMMRVEALRQVGGFNPTIIAGEEPELCVRLRQAGWKVARIDAEMTRHDLAMTRFGQWWRRAVRAGHAYAEGFALHGRSPDRHGARETLSIAFWGVALPLAAVGLAWPTRGLSLLLLAGYLILAVRIARRMRRQGVPATVARWYAWACVVGKFAQAVGQGTYWLGRLLGRRSILIEYKGASETRATLATPRLEVRP
jgi:GT2 family glycosyltransferase